MSFILFLFIFFILSCPLKIHRALSLATHYCRFYTACVTWAFYLGRKEVNIGFELHLQVFCISPPEFEILRQKYLLSKLLNHPTFSSLYLCYSVSPAYSRFVVVVSGSGTALSADYSWQLALRLHLFFPTVSVT